MCVQVLGIQLFAEIHFGGVCIVNFDKVAMYQNITLGGWVVKKG